MKRKLLNVLLLVIMYSIPSIVDAQSNVLPTASNGVITLTEDVILTEKINITENIEINLNNYKLKFEKADNHFLANVTIKNGTIDISDLTHSGDGIFEVGQYGNINGTLTLNNVNLSGENYGSSYGVFYVYASSELNIKDSTFNLKNDSSVAGGVIKTEQKKNGKVNVINSSFNLINTIRGFLDGTVLIQNSTITITSDKSGGLNNAFNTTSEGLDLTIDNSNINISNADGRGITLDETKLIVKNGSRIIIDNCIEGEIFAKTSGAIEADNNSYIDAEITLSSESTGSINIEGGKYTSIINEDFIKEGYVLKQNDDGTYRIVKIVQDPIIEVYEIDEEENVDEIIIGVRDAEKTKKILLDSLSLNNELQKKIEDISIIIELSINKKDNVSEGFNDFINKSLVDAKIIAYYDISILIKDAQTGQVIAKLNELSEEIEFLMLLPNDLKNNMNNDFYLYREHNNKVELVDTIFENESYLLFKSKDFSVYSLAYKENEIIQNNTPNLPVPPQTTDNLYYYIGLGIIFTISIIGLVVYKKENN